MTPTTLAPTDPARPLPPPARATLDDLMATDGKAELIGGKVVHFMATGEDSNTVAGFIFASLLQYALVHGGKAFPDNVGYAVPMLPNGRETFSPDASYYRGPPRANTRKFIPDAPTFAAEVRSENDTGPAQDREYAAKRADYFAAGTLVVWDVDPAGRTVDCYRAADPLTPQRFAAGDTADAEPAVSGWRVAVDWLMQDY